MTLNDLDARLTELFGESDPATDALIKASIAAHSGQLAELETLTARLRDGADAYVKQVEYVEATWKTGGRR